MSAARGPAELVYRWPRAEAERELLGALLMFPERARETVATVTDALGDEPFADPARTLIWRAITARVRHGARCEPCDVHKSIPHTRAGTRAAAELCRLLRVGGNPAFLSACIRAMAADALRYRRGGRP